MDLFIAYSLWMNNDGHLASVGGHCAGQAVTAYGGTPVTAEELGRMKTCLKNHWGEMGQKVLEMWESHIKVATTSNAHACSSAGSDDGEVLNSKPDKPGSLHSLIYFLSGGMMGGFINAADNKSEENVEWCKILTPNRVDHRGHRRPVSQVCFVTKDIQKDDVFKYVYTHSKGEGVGRWFGGEGEVCVGGLRLPRGYRSGKEYLEALRSSREDRGEALPKKSERGVSMSTVCSTYSSEAQCEYCSDVMCGREGRFSSVKTP